MRIAVLLLAAPCLLLGQSPTERMRAVVDHIFRLEHEQAERLCERYIADRPDDPAGYAYLARTYWSRELSERRALSLDRFAASDFFSEDERYRIPIDPAVQTKFEKATAQAIDKGKAALAKNPKDNWAKFILGVAYQNQASFNATLRHTWWDSLRNGTRAYNYHKEVLASDPSMVDSSLVPGVYKYVAGTLSWKVKWFAWLIGVHGNTAEGRTDLERVAAKGALCDDDARTVLALIYTREKNFSQAYAKLGELRKRYPMNYLVLLDLGSVALRMNRAPEARKLFQEAVAESGQGKRYARLEHAIALNHLGLAERAAGDLASAQRTLTSSLSDSTASPRSRAIAHLELGKTLDLLGKRDEAVKHYAQVPETAGMPGLAQEARTLMRKPYQK